MLQRMRRNIRRGEYEFVFAHDGVEALEMLMADKEIDMVVSDINMPRMDGLTLLDQIQDVSRGYPCHHHLGVRRHGEHPNGDEPWSFRFCHQALRLPRFEADDPEDFAALDEWRDALQSRDKW